MLVGHYADIWTLCYIYGFHLLASGGSDKLILVWDLKTGEKKITLTGHLNVVKSLCYLEDSYVLASGSVDHTIRTWNL